MQRQHRLADTRSLARTIVMSCMLLALVASGSTLLAQSPSYAFANGIGGTSSERNSASAADANGNIYVTGRFQGTVDFDPGAGTANLTAANTGYSDIYVASYTPSGAYRWAFRMGGAGGWYSEGRSIAVDASGNIVVSGSFVGTTDFDPGTGTANLIGPADFVARYTPLGGYLWAFQLRGPYFRSVAIDGNGNIVVTGYFHETVDFNPGSGKASLTPTKTSARGSYSDDIFLAKYSSTGSYLWAFRVGSTGLDGGIDLGIDAGNNVYLTGYFGATVDFNPSTATANLTSAGAGDIFVARYSSAGAYDWAIRAGGSSTSGESGWEIAVDGSGNAVVSGDFHGTVDFDPGTGTASLTSVGSNANTFVARYSSTGGYLWAFSPFVQGTIGDIAIDVSGNIYLTGGLGADAADLTGYPNDFDPGPATVTFAGRPGFVAKYTASGAYLWAFPITSGDYTNVGATGKGVTADGNGDVYITGEFAGTFDFDPGEATASVTSAGAGDVFIAKYTEPMLPKKAIGHSISAALTMHVAPNPFTSEFTLGYEGGSSPARIDVIDMMGRVAESREIASGSDIHLGESLPAGAYLLRVTQGEAVRQMIVRKLR
jgi:hypothetical protein